MGAIGDDKDRLLEYAYTLYVQGMCECGHPAHLCRHPDNDGWFTAQTIICHSKAAVERFSEGRKPEPGELVYTTYDRPASKPLPPLEGSQDTLSKPDGSDDQPGDDH